MPNLDVALEIPLPFFLLIWNLVLVSGRDQHPTFPPLIPWDRSGDKHEGVTRIDKRSSLDETAPPVLLDLTATWSTDGTVMSSTLPHVPPGSAHAMP